MPINDTFLLLSGFVKKTEKTPQGEIDKALHYMEDYARRTK
jgi:phage-related protein